MSFKLDCHKFQLNPINPQPTVTLWQLGFMVNLSRCAVEEPILPAGQKLSWNHQPNALPKPIPIETPFPVPRSPCPAPLGGPNDLCAYFLYFFSVRFSFIIFETLFISMEKAKRFDSFHFEFGTHRIPDFLIEICIYIKFRWGRCMCVFRGVIALMDMRVRERKLLSLLSIL